MSKIVIVDKEYIFQASSFSTDLTDAEKKKVEWAWKKEEGQIQYFEKQGFIDDNGIVSKNISFDKSLAGETVYVMPFLKEPDPSISIIVEVEKVNIIFLTFDDGIQEGTEEVLKILKEEGVKGTFFLTGVHSYFSYDTDKKKTLAALKEIYENHAIGNHSYSHANYFYTSYYRKGGVLKDNQNNRRSVKDDFIKNKDLIKKYIKEIDKSYSNDLMLAKNQTIPLARFPGTNTWFVDENLKDIKSTSRGRTFEFAQKDSKEEAEELFKLGYKIFGWDIEWHMTFDLAGVTRNKILENDKVDYSDDEQAHPDHIDLYSEEHIEKDRLTDSWKTVKEEVLDFAHHSSLQLFDDNSKREKKVVLLMHERAFRNRSDNNAVESEKLRSLIKELKKLGAKFRTLENY